MSPQMMFKIILTVLVFGAGYSLLALAQDDEKDLKHCELRLTPIEVTLVSEADASLLVPARARIMPMGAAPSFIFAAQNQQFVAWSDDAGVLLNVSLLETPSEAVFSTPLQPGEEVEDYVWPKDSNQLRVQTNRRILTLEIR